jgi:AhpD family alkylhydroperoxidase
MPRIPGQRLRYPEIAPAGIAAQSSVEHYLNTATALPAVLLELVRLRCSLTNGCEYCIGMHTHELRKHNEPESRIEAVAQWRTSAAFTAVEASALRWAEVMTNIQQGHVPDSEFALIQQHFNERDLVDLTLAIASINAFNRMAIAFRPQWHGDAPKSVRTAETPHAPTEGDILDRGLANANTSALADDGGKVSVDE